MHPLRACVTQPDSTELRRLAGWGAEQPVNEEREALIETVDQRHHDADEYEDDAGVTKKFATSWCDDLAQLDEHLADEQGDARKRATPFGALFSRVGDDVLTGFVDHFACHTHNLSSTSPLEKHCF